jgi:hypothetical protein
VIDSNSASIRAKLEAGMVTLKMLPVTFRTSLSYEKSCVDYCLLYTS